MSASTSKTGMCPKCGTVRNLRTTTERLQEPGQHGEKKTVETTTAHCETCGTFVTRESRDVKK